MYDVLISDEWGVNKWMYDVLIMDVRGVNKGCMRC